MRKRLLYWTFAVIVLTPLICRAQTGSWQPVKGSLTTPWTAQVGPDNVHTQYPRPQMRRQHWQHLNGLWSYKITPALTNTPAAAGLEQNSGGGSKILVPFSVASNLSGVGKSLSPEQKLWYQRQFTIPASWKGQRVLLHFGAVDWQTTVWVNGQKVGGHQGGYSSFSFDITGALKPGGVRQLITISVWDPTDAGVQSVGKQSLNPRGIWYTATSGIWQTVWLEPVPAVGIKNLKLTPDIDSGSLSLIASSGGQDKQYRIRAIAYDQGKKVSEAEGELGEILTLKLKDIKLWSPDHPFLYDLSVRLYQNGKEMDRVESYFGMRKIGLKKDSEGVTRLFLNNEPLFQFGPLDQGFWPDGLYTAPTDEAMKFDILKTKQWGFNMIRKHVKVEPARWYYYCDQLGLLVWQDMPNGDRHIGKNDPDIERSAQSAHYFKEELKEMITGLYNHPSIVTWVPFNEGWGQFQTGEVAGLVKQLDPTRLVNATTGWADRGVGDMHDMHSYPGPGMFPVEANRASVLGEFGGQALVVKDHLWLADLSKAPNHYKTSTSADALHQKYFEMLDSLKILKAQGLSAAVYTQTTDVESEVNGLMTYDRKVMKFDEEELRIKNRELTGD